MQGKCCLAIKFGKSANSNFLGAINELRARTSASFGPLYPSWQKFDESARIAYQTSR